MDIAEAGEHCTGAGAVYIARPAPSPGQLTSGGRSSCNIVLQGQYF